jgi:ribosomal protein L7/L12
MNRSKAPSNEPGASASQGSRDQHARGVLRFRSKTALERGLRAFTKLALVGRLDRWRLGVGGLEVSIDRAFEVEGDADAWPSLVALAEEAVDGVVTLLDGRAETENARVIIAAARAKGSPTWVRHAFTTGTPSAEIREAEVRARRREFGLLDPEPLAVRRFNVELVEAPRRVEAMKALWSVFRMEMAASRALLDALPGWAGLKVPQDRADAARVELEAAGATVRLHPC